MLDKQLLKLLGSNKKYLVITVILMIFSFLANLSLTALFCYAIYLLLNGAELINYIYPLIGALLLIVFRYFLTRIVSNLKDTIGRNIKKDLRSKTYQKIILVGPSIFEKASLADLTQVSIEGIEQLDLYYSTYLPQFFYAMIAPILLFIISAFIDWKFGLVLLACVPLIPLSIVAVSKYANRIFAKYWAKYNSMGDTFLDSIQGLKDLKIYQYDEIQQQRIKDSAEEFRKITMKVLVMQLASITIMDLVAFGGAGIGISIVLNDANTTYLLPILALFLILIAVEFFLPLRTLGSAFHVAMNGVSAGKKIISILNLDETSEGYEKLENTTIKFNSVTFSYEDNKETLKNISFATKENGLLSIVGPSGCGKSTIVKLISKVISKDGGEILVGNHDIDKLNNENYYSNISFVSYNTYIFNTSIRENFKLIKNDISDEKILNLIEKVNLQDFISSREDLDKLINEEASNISMGQKQRLALAINLAADKNIYVFDEITSNIDIESEAIIMKNVVELAKTKNVILISHRLENVVKSNNILYMENGQILEHGTHEELMKLNGKYANLYLTQKSLENGYLKEKGEGYEKTI